jgi:hypothetical protein
VAAAQAQLAAPGVAMAPNMIYNLPVAQVPAYADFMQLTSVGITDLEGVPVNTYRLTWDIPRYIGGPLFAEQAGFAAEGHPNATSLLFGSLASVLLHGLQTEATQVVGVDDGFLYRAETRVEWQLTVAGGPSLAESTIIGFSTSTINRQLNQVQFIPVPQGAFVPPLNLMIWTFRQLRP